MGILQNWFKENENHIVRTVKIAWPAVLESFFVALVGMVDSLMVSRLGTYAVAAVGLTTQPKFLGLALFSPFPSHKTAMAYRGSSMGNTPANHL